MTSQHPTSRRILETIGPAVPGEWVNQVPQAQKPEQGLTDYLG